MVGNVVDIKCKVNPEHTQNVMIENGKIVLYFDILQIIYEINVRVVSGVI